MGLYIKGMQMPEHGLTASIKIYWDGEAVIETPAGWEQTIGKATLVPDHGRLIEADRLKKVLHRNAVDRDAIVQLIDSAPTVIPKDKEGEA